MERTMEFYGDLVIKQTRLPIYLKELLQTDEDVILVYHKTGSTDVGVTEDSNISLIGSPLKINLNVPFLHDNLDKEEIECSPVSLECARKFLNVCYQNEAEFPNLAMNKSIFCICDGTDIKSTVLLGSQRTNDFIIRTVICSKPSVGELSIKNNIQNMVNDHISNVGLDSIKVEYSINCYYELYGYRLGDFNDGELATNYGNILIESSWKVCQYTIPEYGAITKMFLQVVVGHENSRLQSYFEQVCFLSHCLNILKEGNSLEEKVISHNSFSKDVICNKISKIIREVSTLKLPSVPKGILEAIENIDEITITDKLWSILKCCRNVTDLKECLIFLFQSISDDATKVQILIDDTNNEIGKMISNIRSQQMNIPHLSFKQCLEMLIDLGIQKLKAIYFMLMKSCDSSVAHKLLNEWNKIGSSLIGTKNKIFTEIDLNKSFVQLKFFYDMQVLLEFFQLVEDKCCVTKSVCVTVLNYAYDQLISEKYWIEPFTIFKSKVVEIIVPLKHLDSQMLKDHSPTKWMIKMNTHANFSNIKTSFCYSKRRIFPAINQKRTDGGADNFEESDKYFVAVVETYSDRIY